MSVGRLEIRMRTVLFLWMMIAGCRSMEGVASSANGAAGDEDDTGFDPHSSSPPDEGESDGDTEEDNPPSSVSEDACAHADEGSCVFEVCLYRTLKGVAEEGCPDKGEAYCHALEACFDEVDACFDDVCPIGELTSEADSDDYEACSNELSYCLAEAAAEWGTEEVSYRDCSLMPNKHGYLGSTSHELYGYWYSFTDADDGGNSEIDPPESDHFNDMEEEICVVGEASKVLDEQESIYWGAGFGVDLCDEAPISYCVEAHDGAERYFKGVEFDISGEWGDELRVLFKEEERDESAYVNVGPDATHVIALVDQADVWYDPGNPVHVNDITAVQFHIATNAESATPFDLCVYNLVALLED